MGKISLEGTRIAVTGGARGIGLATATELASRGAVVVVGDLDETLAVEAAIRVGDGATGLAVDVSDHDSFASFIAAANADAPVDVLVNNAGIMPIGPFLEQSPETLRRTMEVNVLGCLNGMSLALPAMVQRGSGHIVNVASTAGKTPVPGGVAYCGSKSAVVAITETARVEFAGTGVDFTCVMPHFTNTELIAGTTATRLIPIVQPTDVAEAIADAIEESRKDVFVPKVMGPLLRTQSLLGRRLRDSMSRRLGAYDTFLHFDRSARSSYDDRVSRTGGHP
jgi:NAD(P)-dependent dehydrogenase (short-subunit alcohol dehydrogenase family)